MLKIMLKRFTVLFLILSLIICLFSCSPSYELENKFFEKDFEESFLENYKLVDYNLKYFSASPFDYEIKSWESGKLYLSALDNTDINMYIGASEIIGFGAFGGDYRSRVYVFQHANASSPVEDWTIAKVTLFTWFGMGGNELSGFDGLEELEAYGQNYMNDVLEDSKIVKEYNVSENADFLNDIKSAYKNSYEDADTYHPVLDTNLKYYNLLVQFEENSNIVWHTYLVQQNGILYMECCPYGEEKYYVRIGENFMNELIAVIEEDSKRDIPESTFDEHTTTEDPDGSIAWPYDD